ncbi:hypothetical protein TFLX_03155 [Thermoflexales bacterium]|nr:hypothetical protein TFLX_03155 [Thermoflexales bacterium]
MASRARAGTGVLFGLIGLVLALFDLPAPSTIGTPFVSPLPTAHRVHLPLLTIHYRQSKKCVGLSSGFDVEKMLALGVRCTYVYSPGVGDIPGVEYAGMVRYPDLITVTGTVPYFFGFNEPDLYSPTTGVTPQQAAEIWPRVISANPGKRAISPAPSHLHPEWLEQFYAAHQMRWGYPPKLDVLAIHCYGGSEFCKVIVTQVIGYAAQWHVNEVWVTEFAFTNVWQSSYPAGATWRSEAQSFVDWMNAQPVITRFYWWAMMYDSEDQNQWWNYHWYTQLYDWFTGELNERGQFYQSVR